jgi:hypothetical protein
LLLAAGELGWEFVGLLGDPHALEQLHGPLACERHKLEPSADQGCLFDVRVEYRAGKSEEKRNQNFCELGELIFDGQRAR